MESKNAKARIHVSIFMLYLTLLPISTALSGIIGSVSIVNYVAIAYVMIAVFVSKVRFRLKVDNSALFLYFAYISFSLFWNNNLSFNWYVSTTLLSAITAIVALSDDYSEAETAELKRGVIGSFILSVFVTLINADSIKRIRLNISLTSEMDINDFACGLVVIIALLMSLLYKDKKFNVKAFLALAVCVAIIVFSGSRGAMLMAGIMLVAWVVMEAVNKKYLPVIVLAALGLMLLAFYKFLPEFIQGRLDLRNLIKDGGSGRSDIWRAAFNKFNESNIVRKFYGYGYGAFRSAVNYIAPGHDRAYEAHNIFIDMLIEGGLVGLTLMSFAFAKTFLSAYENKNYCGALAVVGLAVAGISLDMQVTRVFAAVFVIATVLNRQAERSGLPLNFVL